MSATQALLVFKSKGVRLITVGWLGFMAENFILSDNREYIIANYGDDNYYIVYNILSTMACSSIAYGFFKHGKVGGPSFGRRGSSLQLLGFSVQALGLIGLSQMAPALQNPVKFGSAPAQVAARIESPESLQSVVPPKAGERKMYIRCPIDFKRDKKKKGEYSGMERVTRHPALWFLGLSCLGSAVTTVYATHAAMFTYPVVFAYLGGAHQDHRYRRSSGGVLTPDMEAISSNVPFAALLTGR